VDDIRKIYRTRRDALVDSFTKAGWPIPSPKASMFAWAQIPEKLRHMGSLEFSIQLINEAHVAVAPGAGFGEHGDEYVRIALVENEQRIRQAGRNIRKFLAAHGVKEIRPVPAE
jgi:alanine-synthesizing transaminase